MIKSVLLASVAVLALATSAFAHDPKTVTISTQGTKAAGSGGASAASGVLGGTLGKGSTGISVTTTGSSNGGVISANTYGVSTVGQYSNAGTTSGLNSVSTGNGASLGIGGAAASNVNHGYASQGSVTLPVFH